MTKGRRVAIVGLLAVAIAGCGARHGGPQGTDIVVITPGARDDPDWTPLLTAASKRVAARYDVRAEMVDGSAAGGVRAALDKAKDSAQLVIAPYWGDRAAAVRFARETQIPTLVWGEARPWEPTQAALPAHVGSVELAAGEGTFATGVIAAHASVFRSVGIVVCDDVPAAAMESRYNAATAFVKGAIEDDPNVKIAYARAGARGEADAAAAKAATLAITLHGPMMHAGDNLAEPGAQMVLALCGAATPGVLRGIEEAGGEHQFVGVVGDKATINTQNVVLTSAMWNPAPAFAQAMQDVRAGVFGSEPYRLGFANGGIDLLSTGRTPGDALEAGVRVKERIRREPVGQPERQVLQPTHTDEGLRGYIGLEQR